MISQPPTEQLTSQRIVVLFASDKRLDLQSDILISLAVIIDKVGGVSCSPLDDDLLFYTFYLCFQLLLDYGMFSNLRYYQEREVTPAEVSYQSLFL